MKLTIRLLLQITDLTHSEVSVSFLHFAIAIFFTKSITATHISTLILIKLISAFQVL